MNSPQFPGLSPIGTAPGVPSPPIARPHGGHFAAPPTPQLMDVTRFFFREKDGFIHEPSEIEVVTLRVDPSKMTESGQSHQPSEVEEKVDWGPCARLGGDGCDGCHGDVKQRKK